MDLKEQIVLEYLEQGYGYRKLKAKYGIGRGNNQHESLI
jgi:transposase-like protein